MIPLNVFIGWDSREQEAFEVAKFSLMRHSSVPLAIHALKRDQLVDLGLYKRPIDEPASTEFSYTRFFVPLLVGFQGWALFFDCDFLWTRDVKELLYEVAEAKERHAVYVVKHDYRPDERTKMDGQPQVLYPRKNWSSLMLFDCSHVACKNLTLRNCNEETGMYLHQFRWVSEVEIGSLNPTWNWLEGYSPMPENENNRPAAIHYTRGGPWFPNYRDCEYAEDWRNELAFLRSQKPDSILRSMSV